MSIYIYGLLILESIIELNESLLDEESQFEFCSNGDEFLIKYDGLLIYESGWSDTYFKSKEKFKKTLMKELKKKGKQIQNITSLYLNKSTKIDLRKIQSKEYKMKAEILDAILNFGDLKVSRHLEFNEVIDKFSVVSDEHEGTCPSSFYRRSPILKIETENQKIKVTVLKDLIAGSQKVYSDVTPDTFIDLQSYINIYKLLKKLRKEK